MAHNNIVCKWYKLSMCCLLYLGFWISCVLLAQPLSLLLWWWLEVLVRMSFLLWLLLLLLGFLLHLLGGCHHESSRRLSLYRAARAGDRGLCLYLYPNSDRCVITHNNESGTAATSESKSHIIEFKKKLKRSKHRERVLVLVYRQCAIGNSEGRHPPSYNTRKSSVCHDPIEYDSVSSCTINSGPTLLYSIE